MVTRRQVSCAYSPCFAGLPPADEGAATRLALADEALAKGLCRIPELYYCMWTKDFGEDICEYFPIYLKEVDESKFAPDEWITLARKGGTSDLDRKLQWLFDTPSLSLTEVVESFTEWPPSQPAKKRRSASTMAWR
jgi:hypothetical protein